MPVQLRRNDPKLWEERTKFIERLKQLIGVCEITGVLFNLAAHEYLAEYYKKNKPEANRLFLLHPGNVLIIDNHIHINKKPSVEACIVAVYRRRLDACRALGFGNGRLMVADFCQKVVKLKQDGYLKELPPYVLTLSKEIEK